MTDESKYAGMRAYIDVAVQLALEKKVNEIRAALPTETRSAEPLPGPKGDPGEKGADSTVPGPKGDKGDPGKDGIATREELNALIEKQFGELQVRTFADVYKGVYTPDTGYTRGSLVTWGGSLWLAQMDTRLRPGEAADWKLVVKKGADARK